MIDVNPMRCIRTAEEMGMTRRVLLQQADILSGASAILRESDDGSLHEIARKLDRYINDIHIEGRIALEMSMMLEKIAEMYMRTENENQDFLDQIYMEPVTHGVMYMGPMVDKARKIFEDFEEV